MRMNGNCWCEWVNSRMKQTCWCNINGRGQVKITYDNVNTYDINVPEVNFTSPDDSVEITKVIDEENNTITYEIEKECCPDKHVKASPTDSTPWTLFGDKLRVDTSSGLTYNLINSGGDEWVEIGLEWGWETWGWTTVAVAESAEPWYLKDVLSVSNVKPWWPNSRAANEFFTLTVIDSDLVLNTIPTTTHTWYAYNEYTKSQSVSGNDGVSSITLDGQSTWITRQTVSVWWVSTVQMTTTRWWLYYVFMQGSCIPWDLTWIKHQIYYPQWDNYIGIWNVLLEHIESGGWRESTTQIDQQAELNKWMNYPGAATLQTNGSILPIAYSKREHSFNCGRLISLPAWATLYYRFVYGRISNVSSAFYNNGMSGSVTFGGTWGTSSVTWPRAFIDTELWGGTWLGNSNNRDFSPTCWWLYEVPSSYLSKL